MLLSRVLGAQPLSTSHNTLLRCVSAWVDATGLVGTCARYTQFSITPKRGVSQALRTVRRPPLTKSLIRGPLIPHRQRFATLKDVLEDSDVEDDVTLLLPLTPVPDPPPPLPVPPRPPDVSQLGSLDALNPDWEIEERDPSGVVIKEEVVADLYVDKSPLRGATNKGPAPALEAEDTPRVKLQKIFSRRSMEHPPEPLARSPTFLKSLWHSTKNDDELGRISSNMLSDIIALFGTLSLRSSPLPGVELIDSPSVHRYYHSSYSLHPMAQHLITENNGEVHWDFVYTALRDKSVITNYPYSARDFYWLTMWCLERVYSASETSQERRNALEDARGYIDCLRFKLEQRPSRHVYLPYILGLMSLPSELGYLHTATECILQLIENETEAIHDSVRNVLRELLVKLWAAGDMACADKLIEAAYKPHPAIFRGMVPLDCSAHLQDAYIVPSLADLFAVLFGVLHRDTRIRAESSFYTASLISWAIHEIHTALGDASMAASNLTVMFLPVSSDLYDAYSANGHDGAEEETVMQRASTFDTWTIVCGLKGLEAISLEARTDSFVQFRDQLWTSWIELVPGNSPPIVHFVFLLGFLSLARSKDDIAYLRTIFRWLFSKRRALLFPVDPREATEWRTQLSIAVVRAMVSCGRKMPLRVRKVLSAIRQLQPNAALRFPFIINRALALAVANDLPTASQIYGLARRLNVYLYPATLLSYFHVHLAERNIKALKPYLYTARVNPQQVHLAKSWIWNVARNSRDRRPMPLKPHAHILRRAMFVALSDNSNRLPESTWRAVLRVLVDARHTLLATRMAQDIAHRGGYSLQRLLPRNLGRIIALKGSNYVKQEFRSVILSLRKEPMINMHTRQVNPDASFMARKGRYFEEFRLRKRRDKQAAKLSPTVANLFLTSAMRYFQRRRFPSPHRNARHVLTILRKIQRRALSDEWHPGDHVTTNLLFKVIVQWEKLVSSNELKELFDHVFMMGYPGHDRFPTGLFETADERNPRPKARKPIDPLRHALPFYRTFIGAFRKRGDWMAARSVVGLLKDVTELKTQLVLRRQAARRAGRVRARKAKAAGAPRRDISVGEDFV